MIERVQEEGESKEGVAEDCLDQTDCLHRGLKRNRNGKWDVSPYCLQLLGNKRKKKIIIHTLWTVNFTWFRFLHLGDGRLRTHSSRTSWACSSPGRDKAVSSSRCSGRSCSKARTAWRCCWSNWLSCSDLFILLVEGSRLGICQHASIHHHHHHHHHCICRSLCRCLCQSQSPHSFSKALSELLFCIHLLLIRHTFLLLRSI